jgi:hypothetical protein
VFCGGNPGVLLKKMTIFDDEFWNDECALVND